MQNIERKILMYIERTYMKILKYLVKKWQFLIFIVIRIILLLDICIKEI